MTVEEANRRDAMKAQPKAAFSQTTIKPLELSFFASGDIFTMPNTLEVFPGKAKSTEYEYVNVRTDSGKIVRFVPSIMWRNVKTEVNGVVTWRHSEGSVVQDVQESTDITTWFTQNRGRRIRVTYETVRGYAYGSEVLSDVKIPHLDWA